MYFLEGETDYEISAELPFAANFTVTDVWTKENCGTATDKITAKVKIHGARLFKLTRA